MIGPSKNAGRGVEVGDGTVAVASTAISGCGDGNTVGGMPVA